MYMAIFLCAAKASQDAADAKPASTMTVLAGQPRDRKLRTTSPGTASGPVRTPVLPPSLATTGPRPKEQLIRTQISPASPFAHVDRPVTLAGQASTAEWPGLIRA